MILSVVTGTYNRLSHLKAMMASVKAGLPPNFILGKEYEFCIADGGSTDGTLEFLRSHKSVKLVEHGELRGAIAAFNDAAKLATGDYLLIANDDIEFNGFSPALGLAYAMEHPEVGCSCFYQDRNGKDAHVEAIPVHFQGGSGPVSVPYMQVGVIPRWLWERVGGWGDGRWGSKTYGGDNYVSMRVWESGFRCDAVVGCSIKDKTLADDLRERNYAAEFAASRNGAPGFWTVFPKIDVAPEPICENPLGKRKRVLYAPIIEANHTVQKEQKRGLREALGDAGLVWEVDYVFSGQSVADASEAWLPNLTLTQFHDDKAISKNDVGRIKRASLGHICNWVGDVWPDQQLTPRFMDILRLFDFHLVVNATLIKKYADVGIRAAYWQNSAEPQVYFNWNKNGGVFGGGMEEYQKQCESVYDVIFLGNCYSSYRSDLALKLKSIPNIKVGVFGRGYNPGIADGESLYDFAKTGELYRSAKLIIADNQYLEATGFASDRLFMALASAGGMLLHQEVGGMAEYMGLIDKLHYVAWSNTKNLDADFNDLREKILHYLSHDEDRKRIAGLGTKACMENHTYTARVVELQKLLAGLKPRRTTISACMIVRNEEENVDRFLTQLDACVDEIVVVDTGSTDGTVKRIEEFKGKIMPRLFHYKSDEDSDEFIANFSDARNFAKEKCTGDFIFWMDADDVLSDELVKMLPRFDDWTAHKKYSPNPMGFKFPCVQGDKQAFQVRLFRNLPAIKWEGRIHEMVNWTILLAGGDIASYSSLQVMHNGGNEERQQRRFKRNLALLLKEEDSWSKWHYISQCYAAVGRFADALLYAEKTVGYKDAPSAYSGYFTYLCGEFSQLFGDKERAKSWLKKTDYPDALYSLACLYAEEGVFQYGLFKKFLTSEMPTDTPTGFSDFKSHAIELCAAWLDDESKQIRSLIG